MFRRKKKAKEGAAKKKGEESGGVLLLNVAPRNTEDAPQFPLRNAKTRSQSVEILNDADERKPRPNTIKKNLSRATSLGDDLADGPRQGRYGPVYYYNGGMVPHYAERPANMGLHPMANVRQGRNVPSMLSDPVYHPSSHSYSSYQDRQLAGSSLPPLAISPQSPARPNRTVQIIPKMGAGSSGRPISTFYSSSTPNSPISPLSHSPLATLTRTPSPALSTTPRSKGKVIRIVEGWDEIDDSTPKVVQSHKVGVAPTSRVMKEFENRNNSSPFSITIANDDSVIGSSSSSAVQLRGGRRNKARPVSAAPWATINGDSEYQQKTLLEGRNRAIAVSFNE